MRTIYEAARKYAESGLYKINSVGNEGKSMASFKAGVQFAERWIPVEENQYPDLDLSDKFNKRQGYSETVLVKEQGRIYFGFYAKYIDSWIVSGRSGNIHVTHWRYINHK